MMTEAPREHGGNLDAAKARFGAGDWLDLSTGINRRPYPLPDFAPADFTALPTRAQMAALNAAAGQAYGTNAPMVALAGAQQAIQLVPQLVPPAAARVLAPTYNEHAGAFAAAGFSVREVGARADLAGADVAILVNPNNPDGRTHAPADLLALAGTVGLLVVDESFADMTPALSLAAEAGRANILVLRSFGKFFGLAGLRLGFALGSSDRVARLAALAGPWPVSGPAIAAGCVALADLAWQEDMRRQLAADAARLDALVPFPCRGGTTLFRLYETHDAAAAQAALARGRVWSRVFPYSRHWLRLGLPGPEAEWDQLAAALRAF